MEYQPQTFKDIKNDENLVSDIVSAYNHLKTLENYDGKNYKDLRGMLAEDFSVRRGTIDTVLDHAERKLGMQINTEKIDYAGKLELVNEYNKRDRSVKEIAREKGISTSYAYKILRKLDGQEYKPSERRLPNYAIEEGDVIQVDWRRKKNKEKIIDLVARIDELDVVNDKAGKKPYTNVADKETSGGIFHSLSDALASTAGKASTWALIGVTVASIIAGGVIYIRYGKVKTLNAELANNPYSIVDTLKQKGLPSDSNYRKTLWDALAQYKGSEIHGEKYEKTASQNRILNHNLKKKDKSEIENIIKEYEKRKKPDAAKLKPKISKAKKGIVFNQEKEAYKNFINGLIKYSQLPLEGKQWFGLQVKHNFNEEKKTLELIVSLNTDFTNKDKVRAYAFEKDGIKEIEFGKPISYKLTSEQLESFKKDRTLPVALAIGSLEKINAHYTGRIVSSVTGFLEKTKEGCVGRIVSSVTGLYHRVVAKAKKVVKEKPLTPVAKKIAPPPVVEEGLSPKRVFEALQNLVKKGDPIGYDAQDIKKKKHLHQ